MYRSFSLSHTYTRSYTFNTRGPQCLASSTSRTTCWPTTGRKRFDLPPHIASKTVATRNGYSGGIAALTFPYIHHHWIHVLSVPTTLFLFLFRPSTHPTTHNPPRQPPQPYPQQFSSRPACAPRFCRFNLSAAQCTREKTEANIQAKTKFHNPQILPAFPHFGVGLLF